MDNTLTITCGTVALVCAIGLFSLLFTMLLRAKRIRVGRSALGAWAFEADFVGLAELGWDVDLGPARVRVLVRGLPGR